MLTEESTLKKKSKINEIKLINLSQTSLENSGEVVTNLNSQEKINFLFEAILSSFRSSYSSEKN